MEDKENKPRQLSCLSKGKRAIVVEPYNASLGWLAIVHTNNTGFARSGPGPAYLLPTLIGYNRHDPSRYRNPAYSMRERIGKELYGVGPGPCYKIDQQTRYGIKKAPAYTIGSKGSSKCEPTSKIKFQPRDPLSYVCTEFRRRRRDEATVAIIQLCTQFESPDRAQGPTVPKNVRR